MPKNLIRQTLHLFLVIILIAGLLGSGSKVYACSCAPLTPFEEDFAGTTAVFSGTVAAITANPQGYGRLVSFTIDKAWKGVSEPTISLTTGFGGADCGVSFVEGESYLVFANKHENGLSANSCGRTKLTTLATDEIALLPAPTDFPRQQPTSNTRLILGLFLIPPILLLAFSLLKPKKK